MKNEPNMMYSNNYQSDFISSSHRAITCFIVPLIFLGSCLTLSCSKPSPQAETSFEDTPRASTNMAVGPTSAQTPVNSEQFDVTSDWPPDDFIDQGLKEISQGKQSDLLRYVSQSPTRCLSGDKKTLVMVRRHMKHIYDNRIIQINLPAEKGSPSIPFINIYEYLRPDAWAWAMTPMHPQMEFQSVTWKNQRFHFKFICIGEEMRMKFGEGGQFSLTALEIKRLGIGSTAPLTENELEKRLAHLIKK